MIEFSDQQISNLLYHPRSPYWRDAKLENDLKEVIEKNEVDIFIGMDSSQIVKLMVSKLLETLAK